ncbi:NAD-dependent succinate-semialdehyde dehydrogenase [Nitratireductor aquimarinus]|uniref:NAD-dependent succinate-semialdehyde dehydrogenase n=1 Tax=Alphaproteobacteria TaxID=28211 RepID=UPI0019D3A265|nr:MULTISPECIES: NAD-dependent succinate-semialdehyde dehydrogenase [Alphaproteobacteria]MBN7758321.1 NAD-dependent succinate-semialdehyde dehydrogenase [Nitratireductor aquimarinus]MBY6001081.1 NAD-dependent succinate-semialdehyde dehydrogenase [Tritonibacter mobilis]MBY6023114.1 NAD-dependent succinate-semialdehyde dehydrogenase [Nitratireductor sp. DP7N14-4]MCV0380698.1 NAD-dependent succinate-semialdehyde dehydrogenase [Nitratireductor sp.]
MSTYPELHLYIGGEWRKTADDLPVVNPATEQEIGRLPHADIADLDDALAAAQEGFRVWSRTAPRDRADIILRASALMRERQEEIAQSITAEHGKPLSQARLEVIRGCEFLEWDAGEAVRTYGRVIPSAPGVRYMVHHQPIGVVAGLSPWNFPMSQPARKVAGALASGCSIILKAAEETPAGALHIARAFHDAGLPKGVLNLVFGTPAMISDHLIRHDAVRLVAFTGSTAVGRQLTTLASEHMTPVLMELGGHAPVIVCEDTDVQKAAISGAVRKMRNAGQVCTSPTRFFVHESIFDEYADAFVKRAAQTLVGNGVEPGVEMGPLANERRLPALSALVEDARARGAEVRTGGARMSNAGYFFQPTVLVNVPDDARVMQEEPFGPLAVINPVSSLDEAIEKANSVPYGLAAYGFTNRADYIDRMTDGVEAGNLSFNTLEASLPETPFGGVKSSGYGREGGTEGLHNYMVVKNVSHSMTIV